MMLTDDLSGPDLVSAAERACAAAIVLRERSTAAIRAAQLALEHAEREREWSDRIEELHRTVAGLRQAMEHRAVIEQAKGIIIADTGLDADRAFQLLVRQSQHENRKLRDVAAWLVGSKRRA
jgi:AmiR/NasT family two-component response regulator